MGRNVSLSETGYKAELWTMCGRELALVDMEAEEGG